MFHATPLVLPPGGIKRESLRRPELRPPGFDDEFDSGTLFYDVVLSREPARDSLIFIGPPLLNLLPAFCEGRIKGRRLRSHTAHYYLRNRCCDVWIPGQWQDSVIELRLPFGSWRVQPQPAQHELYAGRRVLYTHSKDNEIGWILDWTQFHVRNHGADAVLIYDNASTRYSGEELETALKAAFGGLVVNVVHWPYKFGPQGNAQGGWDSAFCQSAAFQDARFRFLQSASSVLNCDIDELVVSPAGQSIFEVTENSPEGCVMFNGRWIGNATHAAGGRRRDSSRDIRHGDFRYAERAEQCPTKWCVVPRRCRTEEQWNAHVVIGKDPAACRSRDFLYRHFRGISTNWKYHRYDPADYDPALHRLDEQLEVAFAHAMIE
jgi:hypothetical protein